MSTKDAKKKFKRFCKKWNRRKLEEIYYKKSELLERFENKTYSKHNWNFKLSETDE